MEIYRAFPDYSLAELQTVLNLNLLTAMELTRLILPTLLTRKQGHIVNITSLAGKKGHPYDSVYSASKAGLLMWGNALRQELIGTGVYISSVCPGYIADCGVLADSGIPAPRWAGVSSPEAVVGAVMRAIEQNRAEIVVNQGPLPIFSTLTRLLLAMEQFFPRFPDITNRWLGVTRLNQQRIKAQALTKESVDSLMT
jgi:short-subunit dehydrogenase